MMLLLTKLAFAAGYSMDIELVKPYFGADSLPGVDHPGVAGRMSWRAGAMLQWERAPLILYREGIDSGAVIGGRSTLDLGLALDVSRWLSLETTFPLSIQGEAQTTRLAANGFGAGDWRVGAKGQFLEAGPVTLGAHLDLMVPTSTKDSFRGEVLPRGIVGVLAAVDVGRFGAQTDLAVVVRKSLPTEEDYTLGPELLANVGVRYQLYKDRVALWSALCSRMGFPQFLGGGAENAAEALFGLRIEPVPSLRMDSYFGTGLTEGAGTTDFRIGTNFTYRGSPKKPPPPPPPIEAVIEIPPPDITELPPEPEPVVVEWKEQELARVEENQIVIRDPIQFELGTDVVLPVSLPTIDQVAKILLENPQILHLVIEGHASEEGSYIYNYNLALLRANSIWRELMKRGVHPDRISARSMGEVQPKNMGVDEASLAENRRVIFHIVKWWHLGDPKPVYSEKARQPWTGEDQVIPPLPPLPDPPPPPPTTPPKPIDPEKVDPNLFKEPEEEP